MTEDSPQIPGPSRQTLKNLRGMLPSFIKGMEQKRTIGKGKAGMLARPHKCCKVCGLLWDRKFVDPRADIAIDRKSVV